MLSNRQKLLLVPDRFNRNAADVKKYPPEETCMILLGLLKKHTQHTDLSHIKLLDIGCAVRFTQTIINKNIAIKKYCGIDVNQELIGFLVDNVYDSRFEFHRINVYNDLYNRHGIKLTKDFRLPVECDFDIICAFSLFTHLNPEDSNTLLHILHRHIKNDGYLFFSCFIDNDVPDFLDRIPTRPLLNAFYNQDYMTNLLLRNHWDIVSLNPPQKFIQHFFVCRPA